MERLRAANERRAVRLWLGAGLTVGFVACAAALIWAIDGLPVIDPFEHWLFAGLAVPFWLLAPLVGGLVWRPLAPGHAALGAILVGLGGTAVGALAFWRWAGPALVCYGSVVDGTPTFMPLAVGASVVFGGGIALICLVVARVVRQGGRWRAVATSACLQAGLYVVVGIVDLEVVYAHVCRMVPAQP